MPKRTSQKTGSELFIVDNSDEDWKALRYLHDWCQISKAIDIATGYFEIGSLLALDGEWQKVDAVRILMGDEVSCRTKTAFAQGLARLTARLDDSLEAEKDKNDFLAGVPAIVEGIRSGKIQCRVYRQDKFHAKAYITHARLEVVGASALVGSSNFTYPGLTENVELNVQINGTPVSVLQEWYEQHWNDAEDVTAEILRVIERQIRQYTPFDVYARSLQEFFRGHEMTAGEWELAGPERGSRMYGVLDEYQKEGYQALMKKARRYGGALLCDGVGLGKTFVGLMLIERLIMHEGKNVALLVPKAAADPVWKPALRKYLPHIGRAFTNLQLLNHTDLQRGGEHQELLQDIRQRADVVIIDEAHHFRNPGPKASDDVRPGAIAGEGRVRPSRYRRMYDLIDGPSGPKQVFLLTATPINNRLLDLQHMIELFSRQKADHFRDLGIHSLPGHFRSLEKLLEAELARAGRGGDSIETNLVEVEDVLQRDNLFHELVVQRSRAYVVESQKKQGAAAALFPTRDDPRVAGYSVKKTYGKLLDLIDTAFNKDKPLFSLAMYYPLAYYKGGDGQIDPFAENRQKQIVGLVRTQFLKRFESSAHAFGRSCERLLQKLLAFAIANSHTAGDKSNLERWKIRHAELINYVDRQLKLWNDEDDEEGDEDIVTEEMLESASRLAPDEYDLAAILRETYNDLDQIAEFLEELQKFQPKHDDKLAALSRLLRSDPDLKQRKVLIFTEFAETARYIQRQLADAGLDGVEEIDSGSRANRADIIRRFSPYYNGTTSAALQDEGQSEIRILISTDVLSEGLNLQDATRLVNYDLHWNPVRLMQRIGRVDRRMNPAVEAQLLADHPRLAGQRGRIVYWNFLPPDELNALLTLYSRVSHKTLRISRTFGIEGRKLLTPDDDYEAVKEFNRDYEGETTLLETMRLELQGLLQADPELAARLDALPGRVFSGKLHASPGARGVFFCYRIAHPDHASPPGVSGPGEAGVPWTEEAGETRWYLCDLESGKILEEPTHIVEFIRSTPETPRRCVMDAPALAKVRGTLEKHVKNTRLKQLQAPVGVRPALKAWLELN